MAEENSSLDQTSNSQDQSVDTSNQNESRDFEKSYADEVENAKKLRKRAQDAESRIAKYESEKKASREKKLKEEGKFQELLAEKDALINNMQSKYDEANQIISSEKEEILQSFQEEDRADFENLNLTQLKKIQKKLQVQRPDNPLSPKSTIKSPISTKPYSEMTESEKREWHERTVSQSLGS